MVLKKSAAIKVDETAGFEVCSQNIRGSQNSKRLIKVF